MAKGYGSSKGAGRGGAGKAIKAQGTISSKFGGAPAAQGKKGPVAKGTVARGTVAGPQSGARQGGAKYGYGAGGVIKHTSPASGFSAGSGKRGGNKGGAGKGITPVTSKLNSTGTPTPVAGKSRGF